MSETRREIQVSYGRGIHLPEFGLWLDPSDTQPLAFVSHAHSDHIGNHREVIVSTGTAHLMRERLSGKRVERIVPFREFFEHSDLPGARMKLLPAGHVFGSAQLFLEGEQGSLLYSGDFKLRHGLSAEPAETCHAETLIMETTFGKPRYRFPPTHEVMAQMVAFCYDALEEGAVPVLLGYSLGKAQEILCALVQAGLTPMLHGSVYKMTEVYRALSPGFPDGYLKYQAGDLAGRVLLCPPSAARSPMVQRIVRRRVAMMTGWAIDPRSRYQYGVDAAFPLSDHADYDDLLRYVELVAPRRVLTLHGFAAEFARDLRDRGVDARALTGENQLDLPMTVVSGFGIPEVKAAPPSPVMETLVQTADAFGSFAELCESIATVPGRLKKIELLAEYFASLPDSESLSIAAIYFTGRPFAQSDTRPMNAGWAVIKRALLVVAPIGEMRFRAISDRYADAGKTTAEVLAGQTTPQPWSLAESRQFFETLRETTGALTKMELLASRLGRLAASEGGVLVRILTGDLRIGLKEGLVEEAIAKAFDAPLESVREAHMLLGDLGQTAVLAKEGRLERAGVRLFRPVRLMLATPEPDAEKVWARFEASGSAWLEEKYDGIRAQIHRGAGRVEIFSRDLKPIGQQFPELVEAALQLEEGVILDGEIVAYEAGAKLTFFDLQRRLGRKENDLFLGRTEVPSLFVAFDLLSAGGESLLKVPLSERRQRLEELTLPDRIERIAVREAFSAEEIEEAFNDARNSGNEGLIAKDPRSPYTPGRRGLAWIKLKKAMATLDVVVVRAEQGHGKRADVLSDYTFAVRDEATNALLPIGKAYSGLTDAEIADLTAHFTRQTIGKRGRVRDVVPDIVLEVAFDSIQPSSRHASGLSLRFPRIKAIRRDKTPAEIDTLGYARQLAGVESA